ncbi:hypothetical protein TNCV_1702571 [Trichonephila clavipes]|nr:hypothetical protein TNCV_1702571 [Trichonephila clavipes]
MVKTNRQRGRNKESHYLYGGGERRVTFSNRVAMIGQKLPPDSFWRNLTIRLQLNSNYGVLLSVALLAYILRRARQELSKNLSRRS